MCGSCPDVICHPTSDRKEHRPDRHILSGKPCPGCQMPLACRPDPGGFLPQGTPCACARQPVGAFPMIKTACHAPPLHGRAARAMGGVVPSRGGGARAGGSRSGLGADRTERVALPFGRAPSLIRRRTPLRGGCGAMAPALAGPILGATPFLIPHRPPRPL